MRSIPWQSKHQHGVFTTAQAIESGWSESMLTRAVQLGELVRLRRGAYAAPDLDGWPESTELLRIGQRGVAAALRIPAASISHSAAIAVHALPLLDPPALPCVTLEPSLRTRPWNLHVHRQPIPAGHFDPTFDLKLTSVARSCIDLARESGTAAGLVAADAALHRGLCTRDDLVSVYDEVCRGRAGLRDGRKLLEMLDAKAESPLESISRLAFENLPPPRSQVAIYASDGTFIGRVDFYWDELGVVGEADGQGKYSDGALWKEKQREDKLTRAGLVTVRWGWIEARTRGVLPRRLNDGFERAARMRAAGIPIEAIVRP